ncbi:DUF481 domain-containing protein [Alginatibacterium sediminis]|uniref:DUF481 domain-containing protein n=1 Tax=Alginatibacterium sediminis TaxID=2164068 RepID=A0A420E600_9ALTE|nr:DUF481 domain-containing protein [Alginatibacterium sediminis]RKF13279.1 DUF481 domain-containing protein [Alginatibacterium sediminis]
MSDLKGIAVVLASWLLLIGPVWAQSSSNDFPDDQYDWVELRRGERLSGTIRGLYNEELEFKSRDLGTLTIKWYKVVRLLSRKPKSINIYAGPTFEGIIEINKDKVLLTNSKGTELEFDRSRLLTIGGSSEREINLWTAKASLGLSSSSGNSDKTDFSGTFSGVRRSAKDRLSLDYLGRVSEAENIQTSDNHRINLKYDYFFSPQYFFTPLSYEYYTDTFQNIAHRNTLGAALGKHLIDTKKTEWDASVGPAYQSTRYASVTEGTRSTQNSATIVLESELDHEIGDRTDWESTYRAQLFDSSESGYNHHLVSTISYELNEDFDLDFSVIWDYSRNPQPNSDGQRAKNTDLTYMIGLGLSL